jgi:hypothetical protein
MELSRAVDLQELIQAARAELASQPTPHLLTETVRTFSGGLR